MSDCIIRATAGEGSVRILGAVTTGLAEKARIRHQTTPVATAALGRLLTAAAMLGATLKNDSDLITLAVRGDGPLGGTVATADSQSRVKGYVFEPQIALMRNEKGKLDVGGAIGAGTLTVTKDLGLKEPVSGQVELISGEIAEDLTYYFAASEQLPSSVMLGVLVDTDCSVKQAGGLIVQIMPGLPEKTEAIITHLEETLPNLPPLTALLDAGETMEDILTRLFAGHGLVMHERIVPQFYCSCSAERARKALAGIDPAELRVMLEEDKGVNLHCHFCNTDYFFDEGVDRKRM